MSDRFCRKCNSLLPAGANFCAICGEKVTETSEGKGFSGEGNNSENTNNEKDKNQNKTKYCFNCGSIINAEKIICPICGKNPNIAAQPSKPYESYSNNEKNNVVAGLLAIFLGTLGIHKFYVGDIGMGIFYIVITCFGFLFFGIPNLILQVVVLIEGILYLLTDNETFNENYNKNYRQ